MAIIEVIAQEVQHGILSRLKKSQFFSLQIDETTDITVSQQYGVMLRFFDNVDGKVKCILYYKLVMLESATVEGIFKALDQRMALSRTLVLLV